MNQYVERARKEGRSLYEHEARELLRAYDIPVPAYRFVKDRSEAVKAAGQIGYPVTLKVVSKDILHKSDVGGVINGISDVVGMEAAFDRMQRSLQERASGAVIEGFLVSVYAKQGLECAAGMTRDPQLGTALMFGLGGVFVEVMQDVSFGLLPLSDEEIDEMIFSIKGAKLLGAYRGQPAKDVAAIRALLRQLGKLSEENPEIAEIDINPFFVYEDGVTAVDARMIIR